MRRAAVRQRFYSFPVLGEGWREDDPSRRVDAPKKGRPLPKVLTRGEVDALIAAAGEKDGAAGLRLACMIELIYASGLRVSELTSLSCLAVARDPAYLIVRGKGGKERLAPLNGAARAAIKTYLETRKLFFPKGVKESPWLFPSRGKAGRLTPRRFAQLLDEAARDAGVDPAKVSLARAAPRLRRPIWWRWRRRPAGRADPARPRSRGHRHHQIYTHVAEGRLREVVQTKHPLARRPRPRHRRTNDWTPWPRRSRAMWRKALSWTALVANILAVLINLALLVFAGAVQQKQAHPISVLAEAIGLIVVGGFLLSGPVISIFAIIFRRVGGLCLEQTPPRSLRARLTGVRPRRLPRTTVALP